MARPKMGSKARERGRERSTEYIRSNYLRSARKVCEWSVANPEDLLSRAAAWLWSGVTVTKLRGVRGRMARKKSTLSATGIHICMCFSRYLFFFCGVHIICSFFLVPLLGRNRNVSVHRTLQ